MHPNEDAVSDGQLLTDTFTHRRQERSRTSRRTEMRPLRLTGNLSEL
jgi:hypothetical protein